MTILKTLLSRIFLALCLSTLAISCTRFNPPGDTPVHPINLTGPYASVLQSCGYVSSTLDICSVKTLPYLGQDTMKPTVQDVLNRTLVSDNWMADHFRDFLTSMPDHLLLLFRSTTCVILTRDVYYRSYYRPETGCIVIDANALWLTQAEKQSMNFTPYVPPKGLKQLQFTVASRAVKNNQLLFQRRPSIVLNQDRTLDDAKYELAYQFYHELGHAAYFVPIALLSQLSKDQKPSDIYQEQIADEFAQKFPLASTLFKDLAPVIWKGQEASEDQKNITPEQAANEFSADIAVQSYNYSDKDEDLAESFAHFMMFYSFGIEFDIAINQGTASNSDGKDQLVVWGQRRRVASAELREKITFAVRTLMPDWAATVDFNKLESPTDLTVGKSWQENLIH